jgi:glycine dehydrogenase subunit 1
VELTFGDTPFFNEFTLTLSGDTGQLLDALAVEGFLGGVDLNRFGEEMPGDLVVAVTENRTMAEIDSFVSAFARVVS